MHFQNAIRDANAPRQRVFDRGERGSVTGLQVQVNHRGSKSFLFYYRTRQGRERTPKIGSWPEISVGEARRRAKLILDQVAAGKDPKGEWDASRAEMSLEELYEKCRAEYWSREVSKKWARDVHNLFTKNIKPRFGSDKLSEIRAPRIREWLATFEGKIYSGNRSLEVISRLYKFAIDREIIPQGANPCVLVKGFQERTRKRFATPDEMQTVFKLLQREKEKFPRQVAFILMIMFSGSRPSAIARARWEDLEIVEKEGKQYGILSFHGKSTSATGDLETVVFPPQVMELLLILPRLRDSTITGLAKVPQKFWIRIREEAKCPDLWARDFRRTFATVGLSSGLSLDSLGEVLNHRSTQTTKIYAKLLDEKRISSVASIADQIEAIVSK